MENKKSTGKKVITAVVNTLIWIFVIFSVVITVITFAAQSNSDGIPSFGGKTILTVQSDSMESDQGFYKGDIIIGQRIGPTDQKTLEIGEVITYSAGDLNGDGIMDLNSHRIIEVKKEGDAVVYVTHGDHNPKEMTEEVKPESIICIYTGTRIPKLGSVLNYLAQPTGFLIVIVLPLILFFIYELISFIRKFLQIKNAGKKQISAADEELIRQRAVEEYIKAQQGQQNAQPTEQPAEQPAPVEEQPAQPAEQPAEQKPEE